LLTFYTLDYIIDNDIIIAYKMNEIALPPERGFPFQLVAEHKWGYKWIKWITEVDITEYIEIFYRRQRLQPGLGFLSPVVFEQRYYAGFACSQDLVSCHR